MKIVYRMYYRCGLEVTPGEHRAVRVGTAQVLWENESVSDRVINRNSCVIVFYFLLFVSDDATVATRLNAECRRVGLTRASYDNNKAGELTLRMCVRNATGAWKKDKPIELAGKRLLYKYI